VEQKAVIKTVSQITFFEKHVVDSGFAKKGCLGVRIVLLTLGRVRVQIKKIRFVRNNGTNETKNSSRGRKPASKRLLVQRS